MQDLIWDAVPAQRKRKEEKYSFAAVTMSAIDKPGAGTTSVTSYYEVIDEDSRVGVTYYKLKQTDYDGRFKIYPPISVYNNRTYKTVLRCTDLLGRETNCNSGQVRVVEYTDGTKSIMIGNRF